MDARRKESDAAARRAALRRSNAAGVHDTRPRGTRDRAGARRAAVRDSRAAG